MITHSWMFPFGKQTQIGNSTACLYITFLGRFGLATMSILVKKPLVQMGGLSFQRFIKVRSQYSGVNMIWGRVEANTY